jgi:hypothetical protein
MPWSENCPAGFGRHPDKTKAALPKEGGFVELTLVNYGVTPDL